MLDVLTQFAIILATGMFLKSLADKLNFPSVVLFILGGTALATIGLVDLSNWGELTTLIRTIALIVVVFSSAFYLRFEVIKKQSRNILWLSSFGVLITAFLITGVTLYLLPITLIAAAFLGTLLSGTDPAAICLGKCDKSSKLMSMLLGESLFNGPLTVILPLFLLDYLVKPEYALLNVPKLFSLIIVGGIVGVIGAVLGQRLLVAMRHRHEEIAGLMIAITVYVVAENLFGSGILAVAVTSVLLTSKKIPERRWLGEFNNELAFLFTVFVFILLGAQMTFDGLFFTRMEIFTIVFALIVARLAMSFVVLAGSGLSMNERLNIGLISPKGLAPAALAPLLLLYPDFIAPASADFVVRTVYLAIVVSTLISLVVLSIAAPEKKKA